MTRGDTATASLHAVSRVTAPPPCHRVAAVSPCRLVYEEPALRAGPLSSSRPDRQTDTTPATGPARIWQITPRIRHWCRVDAKHPGARGGYAAHPRADSAAVSEVSCYWRSEAVCMAGSYTSAGNAALPVSVCGWQAGFMGTSGDLQIF